MKIHRIGAALCLAFVALGMSGAAGNVVPSNASRKKASGEAEVESIVALAVKTAHAKRGVPLCVGNNIVSLCFAPGTSPEYIQQMLRRLPTDRPGRYYADDRWTATATNGATGQRGNPITLTYSFVADGLSIPGSIGEPTSPSNLFATMNTRFGGNTALWKAKFAESFARWSALTGVRYVEVTDDGAAFLTAPGSNATGSVRGDVRIAAHPIDGGSNTLAYNFFPNTGDMVLDSAENWGSTTNNYRFLRNIVMHEHGHGMGLAHVESSDGIFLMEPFLNTSIDGPQDDDIRGGQRNYGDPYENNDTSATATALALTNNAVTVQNLSTDGPNDVDWFALTVPTGYTLSATVTPVGASYRTGRQNSGTQTLGNSRSVNALNLAVFNSNATSQLAIANSQPAGEPQSVSNLAVPSGRILLRVNNPSGSTDEIQRYTLAVTLTQAQFTISGAIQVVGAPNSARVVTFRLRPLEAGSEILRDVTTAADGSFSLANIPAAVYDVFASAPRLLTETVRSVNITSGSLTGLLFPLLPGDINGDDAVDFADFDLFLGSFGLNSGQSGFDTRADFNEDNTVDFADFELLLNSFGLNGDR